MSENKISTAEYLSMSYDDKIRIMIDTPERLDLPEEASYVAQYLEQYRPVVPPKGTFDNETSVDIQDTLMNICMVDTKVISRIMKMLGYRLHIQGVSTPTWSMEPKE